MDKPRLMVVMDGVWARGGEKSTLYLLQGLRELGYEDIFVYVIVPEQIELFRELYLLPEFMAVADVEWDHSKTEYTNLDNQCVGIQTPWRDVPEMIREKIALHRPDVVIHPFGNHVALACQYIHPQPKVVRVVHGLAANDFAGYVPGVTDMMVAVCRTAAEQVARSIGSNMLVTCIENGVPSPPPGMTHYGGQLGGTLGISPAAFVWAYLAPLSEPKGVRHLIRALTEYKDYDYCLLAGAVDSDLHIPELIKAAGLSDRCFLLGHVRNVWEVYAAADAVVIPSETEAMPLTMLEAMAAGKIVVARRVGGIPDVLEGEDFAVLYDDDLPAALAQARSIPTMAARKSATNLWLGSYDHTRMAMQYHNLFMQLLRRDDGQT